MASREVFQEQRTGGKHENTLEEGRHRRVLRDIGNLVIASPVQPNENKNTRPTLDNADGLLKKDGDAKSLPNKEPTFVINKPKNDEVMVISPERDKIQNSGSKARKESHKKVGKSLTAILTARSKAACGLTNKREHSKVTDIDEEDRENEFAAVEYVEDLYTYYKEAEEDGQVSDYMDSQPEINSKMRATLVDWLIEVHDKFELMPESLYLTVNIIDRFLSVKTVPRRELQLVGISAMLIACKLEEMGAPEVSEFIAISGNDAYVREQVLHMENAILWKLEWYLIVPTAYVFVVRYTKASIPSDKEMENMAFFFAELGLTNYSIAIKNIPSKLSASAVYAARCTLKRSPFWTETLMHYTGYAEDQLMECAKSLVGAHAGMADNNKFMAVPQKYSNPERCEVALFPPATDLLTKGEMATQPLQLMECAAKSLIGAHAGTADIEFNAVPQKYSTPERCAVALFSPATELTKGEMATQPLQLMECAKSLVGAHAGIADIESKDVPQKYPTPERCAVAPAQDLHTKGEMATQLQHLFTSLRLFYSFRRVFHFLFGR